SLFVVGDEKQSIYSFQGANAVLFQSVKHFFKSQVATEDQWRDHALTLSYRSSLPILRVTDDVFNRAGLLRPILEEGSPLNHDSFFKDHYGRVSLWPLLRPLEGESVSKDREADDRSLKADLAHHIASTIRGWLDSGRLLHTQARPIAPSDILILVQKRDDFFFHMITALQQLGVPVGGADRLRLNDQLAFKDLLALGRFLLNPEDDFSLSLALKSPLFGFDEQLIFHLCHGRGEASLWSRLRQATDVSCMEASHQLSGWLNKLDQQTPYQFYADILYTWGGASKMAARQGEAAFEFIQEFLNLALKSEGQSHLSFEGFIQWLETETFEVKRDFSLNTLNTVRVMTVHGAKGLEAPIVFVSDAARLSSNPSKYFWHAFHGQDLLIHKGLKASQPNVLEVVIADHQEAERDEYFRKLYVALTRATTELYITGWKSARTSTDGSWYSYLEQTMRALHTSSDHVDAKKMGLSEESDLTYHVIHEGVSKNANLSSELILPAPSHPLPKWVGGPPFIGKETPRDFKEISPPQESSPDTYAMRRGTFIHKLLEELPRLSKDRHQAAAMHYLKSIPGAKMLESEAGALLNQVQTIITHLDFADLFGSNSYAEVMLYDAALDKTVRIDRLVVCSHEVLIIEYKTGVVPTEGADIQEQYRVQVQGYKAYVERLYPKHRVRGFILAVDNLRLLEVEDL
ncbi:MAG: PD-(D/E)XK nuclease family protein, partial [Alphaproteobacteria bacterium]|nr:PD-(D/E)XK nuclease family protein [Alphaproteobacteria bacterium]